MKYLPPLLFALFLIKCQPETIEKIVYLRDSLKTVTYTAASLDSVRTLSQKIDTVYDFETVIKYDTVLIQKDSFRIDTVTVIQQNTRIDTITIETIRVDTVEREATLTYDPSLENYVDSFFVFAEQKIPYESRLAVDVVMEVADLGVYVSSTEIVEGDYLIKINTYNCYEAGVYRELLHTLYARPYAPYQFHPMIQNWEYCLEGNVNRDVLIDMMFIE